MGNMMSRWTDFLTTDGEKDWRNRDAEFEDDINGRADLIKKWDDGWRCLFDGLDSISRQNIGDVIYIRKMGHTVLEAINRQLAHYAYHIGQIVYLGRMIKGEAWTNLSIPKGKSIEYNANKFEQPKRREHFTKSILE